MILGPVECVVIRKIMQKFSKKVEDGKEYGKAAIKQALTEDYDTGLILRSGAICLLEEIFWNEDYSDRTTVNYTLCIDEYWKTPETRKRLLETL